ncbi:hypothetical protein NDU88_002448 [Pleurodeles waltl]|uniref:Uncharacterized protein n=1 Tax=Pleurodeles waltl TaxID=8319 RepID=A0AAV7VEX5_PLEWA|nr:hypothetical protein NDU88_002448 [Pleurodeles waltl]
MFCSLGEGLTDTLGEDTGDVLMVVGVVSGRERCVVMGVLVMEVVAEDVLHAGVSGDVTGREEGDMEEGDTVEAVDLEDGPEGGLVAAVGTVDSEEEEAEEEDIDNRNNVIQQYFQ